MGSVSHPSAEKAEGGARSSGFPWLAIFWFGTLLIACYYPVLERLFRQWMDDPDVGHGFFVPIVAGYIAWQSKEELLKKKGTTNWWGLAIVAYGSFQLLIGTLGSELFLSRTAFVISVIGTVLLLGGTRAVRMLAFPLFLLFFMIPIPGIVFNQITFPLQLMASELAESALFVIGIPVLREGNLIELPSQTLSVVEACSGIRSLLSLSFLSLVYWYFFDSRKWMMVILFLASVPTAIIANAGRVTLTGILSEYKPELAEGFFHSVEGWIVFLVSLAILVGVHRIVSAAHGFVVKRS